MKVSKLSAGLLNIPVLLCLFVVGLAAEAHAGGGKLPPITVTKHCPKNAKPGEIITCDVSLTTNAKEDYWEVSLTDVVPAHFTFIPENLDKNCKNKNGKPECFFKSMPKRTTWNFWFKFKVSADAPCGKDIVNQVDVRAKNAETAWAKSHTIVQCEEDKPQCKDGKDNDGDGWIDLDDKCCKSPHDNSESSCDVPPTNTCKDGIDNDGNGKIDQKDPCCIKTNWKTEICELNDKPQCSDGKDNDGDGWIDLDDPGCEGPHDNDETDHNRNGGKKLSVIKKGPEFVSPGELIKYTVIATNHTGKTLEDTRISDYYPQSKNLMTYVGASDDCKKTASDTVFCKEYDHPPHSSRTVVFTFRVNDNVQCGTQIMNQADVHSDDAPSDWAKIMTPVKCVTKTECSDGKDNDGDGWIDLDDKCCKSPHDTSESSCDVPVNTCKDGKDNDGNGWIDQDDPCCIKTNWKTEICELPPVNTCKDGKDNDGNGKIDQQDPCCIHTKWKTEICELPPVNTCKDGIDNDGNGKIDQKDPCCIKTNWKTEICENPKPQCSDGKDNDGDGWIDLDDSGCDGPHDDDETNKPQCKDGKDNDGDGKIDFPADPGCDSAHDDDETDKPQCKDGKDNDGDGKIDFPNDPGCESPHDDDEWNQETSPVMPMLECVYDLGHYKYRAYFGYENTGTQAVTIPAGAGSAVETNRFTTGEANRGQPSVFEPGRKVAVFFVDFGGESITWKVQPKGGNVKEITASKHSQPCKPVKPVAECSDKKPGNKRKTSFGYQNDNPFEVKLNIPAHNFFTPAPADRGQPNAFFPGRSVNAFTVESGDDLIWTLGAHKSADIKTLPACTLNTAPSCNAGGPYVSSCQGEQAKITLDASKSSDPDGMPLTYLWTTDCPGATLNNATSVNAELVIDTSSGAAVNCALWLKVSDGVETTVCDQTVKVTECNKDCLGVPGGSAQLDQCGVCNGNNACLDCNGVPFGGAIVDQCGVCGGNNACLDCAGVPNGTAVLDACGVCGGDGRSCLECTTIDITNIQFELDIGLNQLRILIVKIAKRLEREGGNNAKRLATEARKQAGAIYQQGWTVIWTQLPKIIVNCANTTICAESDLSVNIAAVTAANAQLADIAQNLLRNLQNARDKDDKGAKQGDRKLAQEVNTLVQANATAAASVPRFSSVCP